jgi:hypothetical protein
MVSTAKCPKQKICRVSTTIRVRICIPAAHSALGMIKAHAIFYPFISRDLPRDSNTQRDEKGDYSEGLTRPTTPRQRGRLTPCQRFSLILRLTSTSSSPRECSSTTPIPPSHAEVHHKRTANDIFAWVSCLLTHTKTLARTVSSASHHRHSHTLRATLSQIQVTHLPRFLSSEIAQRHSPIYHTNRRLRFRTQPLGLPECLTSLPSSRTDARSQPDSGHYLGKVAGKGICPSYVKERLWGLVCMNILQELTFRWRLPPHYVQV